VSVSFVQSVWTVIALVIFIGIVVWAFSRRKKADFDRAGRMALDDDKPVKESIKKASTSGGSKTNEE
jgi:cytochrome c oxidase cbb3-type subunit 4